jgi:hypothetical protein
MRQQNEFQGCFTNGDKSFNNKGAGLFSRRDHEFVDNNLLLNREFNRDATDPALGVF